jgi:hypothetical protein
MSAITTRTRKNVSSRRPRAFEAPVSAQVQPSLIRLRAYEIYCGRNGGPGNPLSDWIQAERELQAGSPAEGPGGQDGTPGRSEAGSPLNEDAVPELAD